MALSPEEEARQEVTAELLEARRKSMLVSLPDIGEEPLTSKNLEAAWPRLSKVARAQIIKDKGGIEEFTKVLKRNHA